MYIGQIHKNTYLKWGIVISSLILILGLNFISPLPFHYANVEKNASLELILEPEDVIVEVIIMGTVVPKHRQTLAAPVDSTILELFVIDGEFVEKGELLARLDTAKVDVDLRVAEIALLHAQERAAELNAWHNNQEVVEARKALQTARRLVDRSEETLNITKKIFSQGIIPKYELNASQREFEDSKNDLISAEQSYQKLLAVGGGTQRRMAHLELENATLHFEELKLLRERSILRAPRKGIVEFIRQQKLYTAALEGGTPLTVGDQVTAGKALFTIQSTDRLLFKANVNEVTGAKLFVGQRGDITSEAYPNWGSSAILTHIASKAHIPSNNTNSSPTVAIKATLDHRNQDDIGFFRVGGEVYFSAKVEVGQDLLMLPSEAIHFSKDATYVMVRLPNEKLEARHIEIGPSYVGKTQVLYGLQVGDTILVPHSNNLP